MGTIYQSIYLKAFDGWLNQDRKIAIEKYRSIVENQDEETFNELLLSKKLDFEQIKNSSLELLKSKIIGDYSPTMNLKENSEKIISKNEITTLLDIATNLKFESKKLSVFNLVLVAHILKNDLQISPKNAVDSV